MVGPPPPSSSTSSGDGGLDSPESPSESSSSRRWRPSLSPSRAFAPSTVGTSWQRFVSASAIFKHLKHQFSKRPTNPMGSSSDSDSDSDSSACLVYKKARVVKWSDDEASDEDAPITLPDREDSPEAISPGGRSTKRRRTSGGASGFGSAGGGASAGVDEEDINEILGLSNPGGGASAASRRVNSDASEAIRRNREQMAAMRRAATDKRTVEISDDDDDAGPGPAGDVPGGGNPITLKLQLSNGRSHEFRCKDGERFSKILADFLESDAGRPLKGTVQGRMMFDGDVIDLNTHTPKSLDMEDEDMVDLN